MPTFRFHCPHCSALLRNLDSPPFKFCPYCGKGLIQKGNKVRVLQPGDSRDSLILATEFKSLLSPIVELNGYSWLADKVGVDESRVHAVFGKQKHVTLGLADRWLSKLGLSNALIDGTLHIIEKRPPAKVPEPPPTQFFEE